MRCHSSVHFCDRQAIQKQVLAIRPDMSMLQLLLCTPWFLQVPLKGIRVAIPVRVAETGSLDTSVVFTESAGIILVADLEASRVETVIQVCSLDFPYLLSSV